MTAHEKEKIINLYEGMSLDEKMVFLSAIPTDLLLLDLRRRVEEMSDVLAKIKEAL